jgi:23S rRNA (guanosine2251-2'-O)-methyltransferase
MFLDMKHRPHHSNKPHGNKGFRGNDRNSEHKSERPAEPKGPRASLYGFHAVREAWLNPKRVAEALYVTDVALKGFEEVIQTAKSRGLKRPQPIVVDKNRFDNLVPKGAVHQGLALACSGLEEIFVSDMVIRAADKQNCTLVMLDQVTDPHNVGAIMRSSAAFGVDGMIMQKKHAPELDGVLAKSACGAVEHVPVAYETNLSRAIEELKEGGFFVFGLSEHAKKTVADIKPGGKVVLVLGSEGDGMRRLISENCDEVIKLPTQGPIQSLNVSNAAAVMLYAMLPKK